MCSRLRDHIGHQIETMNLLLSAYYIVLKQYWKQGLEVREPRSCAFLYSGSSQARVLGYWYSG